jgi:hypothetical protein
MKEEERMCRGCLKGDIYICLLVVVNFSFDIL